ncbi:unnamed protein product [Nesidiocoris tenuis]|uniref:Uncharacterized protein n=1 Tax=Nesidiocoris tenuis TaxID=355587 RepID=A0A6H5FW62_9HEMI|nr:unnamed protein product [Nesidiocoris tenuis]
MGGTMDMVSSEALEKLRLSEMEVAMKDENIEVIHGEDGELENKLSISMLDVFSNYVSDPKLVAPLCTCVCFLRTSTGFCRKLYCTK